MDKQQAAALGYTIFRRADEFFPVVVTFLRPDGFSTERTFRDERSALAWIEEMESLSPGR